MTEKYSKLFSLPENIYAQGAPIIIKAGALLKDNESNWLIAQLKLQNISNKIVKLAKVEINLLDSVGRYIEPSITFDYLDLTAARGDDFGTQTPIRISNPAVRSYTAKVVEVGFSDNTVWNGAAGAWVALPAQSHILSVVGNEAALYGYKSLFGAGADKAVCDYDDLWMCACGKINHFDEERCYSCNASHAELKNLDLSILEKEAIYARASRMAKSQRIDILKKAVEEFTKIAEYKDSAVMIRDCNFKMENKIENIKTSANKIRKKLSKVGKIAIVTALVIIAGCLLAITLLDLWWIL